MNLILSRETVTVNGKSIPKIYGGFGVGQPVILAKQVAEIHEYEVREINQLVNKNLDWFDEGIDYLDLKPFISNTYPGVISNDPSEFLIKSGFYPNSQAIGGAKYIYLFSQQGYAMLCKLLKSELAKTIYKQMIREYFQLLENKQESEMSRTIEGQTNRKYTEGCWLSGKLAEVIVEGIQQNREEMNRMHLELRDLKEEVKALKKLSTGNSELSTTKYSNPIPKSKSASVASKIEELETDSFIDKKQGERLQQIVHKKAKTQKERNQIWAEFKKQFEVSRYLHLPKARFKEALKWLRRFK